MRGANEHDDLIRRGRYFPTSCLEKEDAYKVSVAPEGDRRGASVLHRLTLQTRRIDEWPTLVGLRAVMRSQGVVHDVAAVEAQVGAALGWAVAPAPPTGPASPGPRAYRWPPPGLPAGPAPRAPPRSASAAPRLEWRVRPPTRAGGSAPTSTRQRRVPPDSCRAVHAPPHTGRRGRTDSRRAPGTG